LSVAGSLIDNARDAYDEYKAGDLDYKDFIRYGADTATNIIPGMKALKNAKKIGSKLGLLDKLKLFKSGGTLSLQEKKELVLYKDQLKEIAGNSKELTKLQHEKLKDYIEERRKSARINDDRIWKILSKMIKV
jgi:methyltransferase-like protein